MPNTFDQLSNHFGRAMLGVVPPEADFDFFENGGAMLIACSWLLGNDPERPHKRSRAIQIKVSRRLSDMLKSADEQLLGELTIEVLEVVGHRMREYSPDQDLPYGAAAEPFRIDIDLVDLKSRFD